MKLRKIKMKKKASVIDPLIWIVVAFVVVTFFAFWVYGFKQLTDTLIAIPGTAEVNISDAAQETFGVVEPAQRTGLQVLAYILIFAMALSILLTNYLERVHPAFFIVYLFVIIGAVIASVYISNQYETLMTNEIIGSTLTEFTGGSFILLYLPIWVTVIGFFGAIFLFAGIMRDRGMGESIV